MIEMWVKKDEPEGERKEVFRNWGSIRKREGSEGRWELEKKGERGGWIGSLVEKEFMGNRGWWGVVGGGGKVFVVVKPSLFLSYM